ncbi:MAG: hypothetical protein R2761_15880 [Acidimicrobiales bacterium]
MDAAPDLPDPDDPTGSDRAAPAAGRAGLSLPRRRPRTEVRQALAELSTGRPPFVSIYLDISPGQQRATAGHRLEAAGRGLESATSEQHRVLSELAAAQDPGDDDACLVALIDADGRALVRTYPVPPRWDVAVVANLPYLGPILHAEQGLTHHVVAVVDPGQASDGAVGNGEGNGIEVEVLVVPRHGDPVATRSGAVDGFALAAVLRDACLASRTRLLTLAAPAAELPGLAEQVRAHVPVEIEVEPVATDDLDSDALSETVHRITATHAARVAVELLRLWRFHHSQGEAVTGVADSLAALNTGRAALVLIQDDPADDRTAWFTADSSLAVPADVPAPEPTVETEPAAAGGEQLSARLVDVAVRSALLQGCPVQIVPTVETLDEGIGVILDDQATAAGLAELLE